MQPRAELAKPTAASILSRALEMKGGHIPLEGAQFILDLGIRAEDKQRMLDLLARNQEGEITAEEAEELAAYIQVDNLLSILQVKALVAMKNAGIGP